MSTLPPSSAAATTAQDRVNPSSASAVSLRPSTATSTLGAAAAAASSAESTPRAQFASMTTDTTPAITDPESRASLSSASASTWVPQFGRNLSAGTTVVSIRISEGQESGMAGDGFDSTPAVPMMPPNLSPSVEDQSRDDDGISRPTTASALLGQVSTANSAPRSRYTTAAPSASDCTAVHTHQRPSPNRSGDWSSASATRPHSDSTPRASPDTLQQQQQQQQQPATMSHSPSSATITLFDGPDAIRPLQPLAAESQPLTLPKATTTVPNVTGSSSYATIHDHSNKLKQFDSSAKNDLASIYTRLCPYPPAQKLIPRTRTRRIVCCVCLALVIVILSIGIYIAITLSALVPPKLDVLRTSAPTPPRQPIAIDTNGPVMTIQWDLVVSIANANSIPIDLYDIRFAGYTSPNATQVPLASGNLTTMSLPARITSTTPSRSEWLVPVTIPWRVRDSTQNAFIVNLLTACNVPKVLVPSGATVKPGDKIKLWYTVDAGVERLKWFAGGYRHKHEAWAEFVCPVNLAEAPGIKEIADVVGTVSEVVGGLLQNGAIPDVRLPTLPFPSSSFGP